MIFGGRGRARGRRISWRFASGDLAASVRRDGIDTDDAASDHKPVWTEIDL